MDDPVTDAITETIRNIAEDLGEILHRLASGQPLYDLERESTARILDRLAEETSEAASMLRGTR